MLMDPVHDACGGYSRVRQKLQPEKGAPASLGRGGVMVSHGGRRCQLDRKP